MASFHLAVKAVSRGAGRSATGAAAYRAGVEITDERTGLVHDYTRKSGIEHCELVLPDGAPEWAQDRAALWNAAEDAERRKDAKVAREIEVALPVELSADERRELAVGFAREVSDRYGVAVDVAIHAPGREGDHRNHHAHLLVTTRRIGPEGLGEKTRELDVKVTAAVEVEALRQSWADRQNRALELAQVAERVDHRSFERQGLAQEATIHMGPAVAAMERRAEREASRAGRDYNPVTKVGQHNADALEKRSLRLYIERGAEWLREVGHQVEQFGRKLYGLAASMSGAIESDQRAAAEAERARQEQERQAALERERAAEARRQAEIARKEGIERGQVADRFEKLAANRQAGARGYSDKGDVWSTVPEQLRKVVDDYNAAPQKAKDLYLERIRSEPPMAKAMGQLLDKQQRELSLVWERQLDRGMER